MSVTTDDLRIQEMQELISPEELIAVLPVSETVSDTVSIARR
ncbi:MAG: 3-deoxy-7-phosphoheptulonate synthase, partial [Gammaproteobacteria bacterium]|nr:3-deoxy-7-phosphoheptulonate synthase [Gammaproteobacteria bacterium]